MKKVVDVKAERKEREIELAWRTREKVGSVSKEQAWERFNELHAKACRKTTA